MCHHTLVRERHEKLPAIRCPRRICRRSVSPACNA